MIAPDLLGDRMKAYESAPPVATFPPEAFVMARLDGRAFHSFCRSMVRPYDAGFVRAMRETTRHLVHESNARVGYCQSDEITLAFPAEPGGQRWFGGRLQKLVSILAAECSVHFARRIERHIIGPRLPVFDCRVWAVPSLDEAVNVFRWRQRDAVRNSILMLAQEHLPPSVLHGTNTERLLSILRERHGIEWSEYPDELRQGSFARRVTTSEPFTAAEMADLPPKHAARSNPSLAIERSRIEFVTMPRIDALANPTGVLFDGQDPEPEP